MIEVRAIVGLPEVAVDELEAVASNSARSRNAHPLVAIVEIVLREAVARRVEEPVGARVAAVEAVHLVRTRDSARGLPTAPGIDGLARQLEHVGAAGPSVADVSESAGEQIRLGRDREILRRLLFLAEALVIPVEEQLAAHDRPAQAATELIAVQIATGRFARLLKNVFAAKRELRLYS